MNAEAHVRRVFPTAEACEDLGRGDLVVWIIWAVTDADDLWLGTGLTAEAAWQDAADTVDDMVAAVSEQDLAEVYGGVVPSPSGAVVRQVV